MAAGAPAILDKPCHLALIIDDEQLARDELRPAGSVVVEVIRRAERHWKQWRWWRTSPDLVFLDADAGMDVLP